jgi:hypothetical protein
MKNTVVNALIHYGFEAQSDRLFAGRGSWLVGGETIEVSFAGEMVTICRHEWLWNQYGECEYDRTAVTHCRPSQIWENLPEWVLKR